MDREWYTVVNGTRGFFAVENYKGEIVKDGLYYREATAYVKVHTAQIQATSEIVDFIAYLRENTDIVLAQPEGLLGSTLVPTISEDSALSRLIAGYLGWKTYKD